MKETPDAYSLRCKEGEFNFKSHCFFCGQLAKAGSKRKSSDILTVRTIEMKDTILAVCRERGDSWADSVQARILHIHDLHAADAVYHQIYSVNFRTKKQIPSALPYSRYISFRKMFVLSRTRDFRLFYFRSCVDITN